VYGPGTPTKQRACQAASIQKRSEQTRSNERRVKTVVGNADVRARRDNHLSPRVYSGGRRSRSMHRIRRGSRRGMINRQMVARRRRILSRSGCRITSRRGCRITNRSGNRVTSGSGCRITRGSGHRSIVANSNGGCVIIRPTPNCSRNWGWRRNWDTLI
jgi:hypothetical protein